MNELSYIDGDELVFNNEGGEDGIHSGGFSVKSIMMKAGMSPIMTANGPSIHVGGNKNKEPKVSDLFSDLVVPNWTLSYNNRIVGGKYKEPESHNEDDVLDDDLHERLLELVKQHDTKNKVTKNKITRKNKKHLSKKGTTKRNKYRV